MKILMLSWEYPPVVVGGLGKHVYHLAEHLTTIGHEVVVLARQPAGTSARTHPTALEEVQGVKVIYVAEDPHLFTFTKDITSWILAMQHSMLREGLSILNTYLPNWQPEIIHAHDWLVADAAIFFREFYNIPLVTTVHATEAGRHNGWLSSPVNQQIHSLEWWLCQTSDALITCSHSMAKEVSQLFKIDFQHINIIHNGIDLTNYWSYQEKSIPGEKISYIGRLEYEKGIQDLIDTVSVLQKKYPNISLKIVGEGTQYTKLVSQTKELGLTDTIVFTGLVSSREVETTLKDSTLVVLPSIYEPFGLVALEAAAVGTPIVAANTGGLAEIIQYGQTGLTFPPKNKNYLYKAIDDSLQNLPAAKSRAKIARKKVEKDFTWDRAAKKTSQLYQLAQRKNNQVFTKPFIGKQPLL